VYSRVKELGEGTAKLSETVSSRFTEQEEDSKRLRALAKQSERLERALHRLERKIDEASYHSASAAAAASAYSTAQQPPPLPPR
jgi:hypothetical protein